MDTPSERGGNRLGIRFLVERWPYPQHDGKWLILFELRYQHAAVLFDELMRAEDASLEAFADRMFAASWRRGPYTTEQGMKFLKLVLETFRWQGVLEWEAPVG